MAQMSESDLALFRRRTSYLAPSHPAGAALDLNLQISIDQVLSPASHIHMAARASFSPNRWPWQPCIGGLHSSGVLLPQYKPIKSEKSPMEADEDALLLRAGHVAFPSSGSCQVDYELHIICGVNPKVTEGSCVDLFKKRFKFEYFHINFWAKPKRSPVTPLVLFFAECSNIDNDEEERPSLCVPVMGSWIDDARCFCCEHNGIKIVHPWLERYNGRYEDFHKMASGEHGVLNEFIISSYDLGVDDMCTLKEDWIYFDPNMDAKIAQMNLIPDWARKVREWGRII